MLQLEEAGQETEALGLERPVRSLLEDGQSKEPAQAETQGMKPSTLCRGSYRKENRTPQLGTLVSDELMTD